MCIYVSSKLKNNFTDDVLSENGEIIKVVWVGFTEEKNSNQVSKTRKAYIYMPSVPWRIGNARHGNVMEMDLKLWNKTNSKLQIILFRWSVRHRYQWQETKKYRKKGKSWKNLSSLLRNFDFIFKQEERQWRVLSI